MSGSPWLAGIAMGAHFTTSALPRRTDRLSDWLGLRYENTALAKAAQKIDAAVDSALKNAATRKWPLY